MPTAPRPKDYVFRNNHFALKKRALHAHGLEGKALGVTVAKLYLPVDEALQM